MKVFLLQRDRDFEPKPELHDPVFAAMISGSLTEMARVKRDLSRQHSGQAPQLPGSDELLAQDLELATLWNTMGGGDEFVHEMAKRAVLSSLTDLAAIGYRQAVLSDCLAHPEVVREIYELAFEALTNNRRAGAVRHSAGPGYILRRSVNVLKQNVDVLRRLRQVADEQSHSFRSEGFARFFTMLRDDLADGYLETVRRTLHELGFEHGVRQSAELTTGDNGHRYRVHVSPQEQSSWIGRLTLSKGRMPGFSFEIDPGDEEGIQELDWVRANGIDDLADAVTQAADHVQDFMTMLRLELAFYLGALNLHEQLEHKGRTTCFPEPRAQDTLALSADDLYDVCLTLHLTHGVVGNTVRADGKSLVVITGANQGGKSTALRSLGLAQLMMQCGMFVGARAFRASVCTGVFTHYRREEDATMHGGKLDEELSRMSDIAGEIGPGSILLCNESFAATNEREGSEIARQVVRAMLDKRIRVVFVTHMYDLAHGLHVQRLETALFLRAERQPDGRRTFKLLEREPLPTSYGEDSYRRIFAPGAAALRAR